MVPERIVCTAAEIPEILERLGELDRVVGISVFTTRPAKALALPKVSGFRSGRAERVMRTRPDLVILTSDVQRDLAARLGAEGATLLHLNPHRLEDMFQTVLLIGSLVGRPERARAVCDELRAEIEKVRRGAQDLPVRPRVYFEEWFDPLMAGTGWVSDLIEIAGGHDIFRDLAVQGRKGPERVVNPGQVVEAAPEIIFASWCGKKFVRERLVSRPGFETIPAVKKGRVYEVCGEVLQCGPMLIDALWQMHRLIHAAASEGSASGGPDSSSQGLIP